MAILSKLTMAVQDFVTDFSWLKWFWTGNLVLVVPSLALIVTKGSFFYDKSAGISTLTGEHSHLRFWQFAKKIHYYYMFGALWTGWITLNVGYSYMSGSPINHRLDELCQWVLSPKTVTVDGASTLLASGVFLFHLLHRLYVSSGISIFSRRQALNPFDLLLILGFYASAGLTLIAESPDFIKIEGLSIYNYDWVHWYHIAGLAMFIGASIQHHKSHSILAQLRRNKSDHIVSTGYKIPRGGLFNYVSCPHYFSEMLIYTSIGLMLGMKSQTCWLMVSYVYANQIYMAYNTHLWYKKKFDEYPRSRKIIIPFIL